MPMLAARRSALGLATALLVMLFPPTAIGEAADAAVTVRDSFFDPTPLTILPGTTVVWTQDGGAPHTVTAADGSFDSHPQCGTFGAGCMGDGDTYSRAFSSVGTFSYYCKVHGTASGSGMAGVIRVIDPATAPTTVDRVQVVRNGATLTVSGKASFGGLAPLEVGDDPAGDSAQGYPSALGFDVRKVAIGQPHPATGDFALVLEMVDLPPTGGIPQLANYAWDLAATPQGGTPVRFRVVGSLTNVAQGTNSPNFTIARCGSDGLCGPTTSVSAVMDGEANRVTATIPRSTLEQLVGASLRGGSIGPGGFGFDGGAVYATPSANAIGSPHDRIDFDRAHEVADRVVRIGIVPAGGVPVFDRAATLRDDGSFSLEVPTGELAPGAYDVWGRACFGTNCAQASTRITV